MKTFEDHQNPPRPPLVFRVGVVGHRPNRLGHADPGRLADVVREILVAVKSQVQAAGRECEAQYDGGEATLRAITPLAEGTDRIFAEVAVDVGFELYCVLPFHQAEFEHDFAPDKALESNSLERFRHLLARAANRFELDGMRTAEEAAYAHGGTIVINQSDILLAVWDGERLARGGGTEQTFDEARSGGVPVVWVDAHAPHEWQVIDSSTPFSTKGNGARAVPDPANSPEFLRRCIHAALAFPLTTRRGGVMDGFEAPEGLRTYYAERNPRHSRAVVWTAFRDVVADGKMPAITFRVPSFQEAVKREWSSDESTPVGRLANWLLPFYAWPDQLAVLYSNRYRSTFIVAFLLAATAVGMALLPVGARLKPHQPAELLCVSLELIAILTILGVVLRGRHGRWHERWLDYRLIAELVRHLRLVAPLGGGRPFPQVPAQWATYGQPGASWMAWYVRAVERAVTLPTTVVDQAHVATCLRNLDQVVDSQIRYHEVTARRNDRIEKRLHIGGIVFLVLTLLACGIHLIVGFVPDARPTSWLPPPVLTLLCGFFPAVGAALAGINNQGEFRRIAKRSHAMREQLDVLREEINAQLREIGLPSEQITGQPSTRAASLASDVARLLVNEVLDWRVVLLDRPLRPPV